jgi:hypothetical protein
VTFQWNIFIMRNIWALPVIFSTTAGATDVGPCNDLDRISYLVDQTKSFSNGKIKIAHVDTDGEPVCCSEYLLIFIPSAEIGSQCFAVSQSASQDSTSPRGFHRIEFNRIKASYDPKRGLLLNVPYRLYDPDRGREGLPGRTNVRIKLRDKASVKIEQ